MRNQSGFKSRSLNRRSFVRGGLVAGGAAVMGAGLLSSRKAEAQSGPLTNGDAAILRFLAAAEIIESDLWIQYTELGGLTPGQVPVENNPNFVPMNSYQAAFMNLDGDGPQYISSNTLDEISHATFINAYLESKGEEPVDLTPFANLKGSTATGSSGAGRLTN